jgi:hypothetical protein
MVDRVKMKSQIKLPRIKSHIKWVKVSDSEIRIYDPLTCMFNTLRDESSMIWELLDGNNSITQIATILSNGLSSGGEAFDQVFREINDFITALENLGLVECDNT